MTRLSIIDLDTGNQPIFDASRRFSIVFNGEIYNYRPLRERLLVQGVQFSTHSDTEVILQGYLKWGRQFLAELQGMFALAIYDVEAHELFVARDRLGKKPFYYYIDHEQFVFASEAQSLAQVVGSKLYVDDQSYWDYLTFRYVPGEGCALKGMKKLQPGHCLRIVSKVLNPIPAPYWKLPQTAAVDKLVEPSEVFGNLFAKSVEMRLIADVPVGVVLSGGIDSAAVLYEARRSQPINSYHVYFREGENYNELKYAEMAARHLGSKLQVVEMSEDDFLSTLDEMATLTDEPLSDLASVPFKYVCDLAARDVKVVLSGEGSDEVLGGYDLHYLRRNFLLMDILERFPGLKEAATRICPPAQKHRLERLAGASRDWPARNNFNVTFQASQAVKLRLLTSGAETFLDSSRYLREQYSHLSEEDPINQILHVLMSDWLIENVLMKSDKVSMSSSIEVRCPFLDHKLVEYLFSLPGRVKVGWRGGRLESKTLLRRYLNGKIPTEILNRKKLGFPVPAYALSSKKYQDYLFDILSAKNRFYERIFDRRKILALYDAEAPGTESDAKHFLWSLAIFERWYDARKPCLI